MKLEYQVHISDNAFQRLKFLAGQVPEKSVKAFGTIYARALAAATPPHTGAGEVGAVLRSKSQRDITILRERISWNIAGVNKPGDIQGFAQPVPFRNLSGQWLAIDTETRKPAKPRGFFGIVVPTSWAKVRGQSVPETSPEQAYAGARWDGKKLVSPTRKRKKFVRKNALAAFIKRKQTQAGKLISGWAPGARVFATGAAIAAGFFESLGGKGFGRMYTDKKGRTRGVLVNRQAYNPKQADLLKRRMSRVIRRTSDSRAAQILKIKKWYAQQAKKALGVN